MSLNLYTPADGLYRTHVTWEDIEEDMQREFDTVASFGPNKIAKDIGDNNGFMSKMLLIEPDWQHKDKKLPEKFLVKILTQLAMQKISAEMCEKHEIENTFTDPKLMADLEVMQKMCHNAEVKTYNHLMKLPKEKMRIPKVYYMRMFTEWNPVKGYIIMEYLENLKSVPVYENVTPEEVKQVLRHKAVMEASSLEESPDVRNEYVSPFKTIFGAIFKKEVLDQILMMFSFFGDGKIVEKGGRLKDIISDMVDLAWVDNMTKQFGMESVLCHGDLWSNNLLWRQKGDHLEMAAVIDYQTVHYGCAATDLVRLLCSCLSGKDRRAHWEPLLEEFYGYLKEEVGNRKMPYTLEQLKEAYRQYMPIGGFMIVPGIGALFEILSKTSDEETKKKGMATAMEKTECLLDDIFFFHQRNLQLRKQEKLNGNA
nr:Uncharacterised kinase D1044.1 domain containing protein [Haemonchus contortus]